MLDVKNLARKKLSMSNDEHWCKTHIKNSAKMIVVLICMRWKKNKRDKKKTTHLCGGKVAQWFLPKFYKHKRMCLSPVSQYTFSVEGGLYEASPVLKMDQDWFIISWCMVVVPFYRSDRRKAVELLIDRRRISLYLHNHVDRWVSWLDQIQ